jgi:two-component system OmpR family response regulator
MLLLNHGMTAPVNHGMTAPALQRAATSGDTSRRRVLVVDDHEPTAVALSRLMGLLGHEVRIAADGSAALEVIEGYRPDLVFLDLGLPRVDGCAVARQMRSDSRMSGVTLIALTGYGSDEDRTRVRDAGFDYHLLKPVTIRTLESLLESPRHASTPSTGTSTPIGQ